MNRKSKILIVEDNYDSIKDVFNLIDNNINFTLDTVSTSREAIRKISETTYDLMIIDLQIPESIGEDIDPNGGKKLLEYIDTNTSLKKPIHILGLTAHQDSFNECKSSFHSTGWSLLKKSDDEDTIKKIIEAKLRHAANPPSKYDICILTALPTPELEQLLKTKPDWIPVKYDNDCNTYHSTTIITASGKELSLIASSCHYMGIAQSSAIGMKMCLKFSPDYFFMTGIAAGIEGKVKLGDVLVSDICWDWGNGKQTIKDGKPIFLAAPRQESLEPLLKAKLNNIASNRTYLDEIYNNWPRNNRPENVLNVHIGPLATGAVVLEDPSIVEMIQSQHRETIGVEMEAYGVALAASLSCLNPPKTIIMKSVCDFADPSKNNEWQDYAAYTSAQLAIKFIENDLYQK